MGLPAARVLHVAQRATVSVEIGIDGPVCRVHMHGTKLLTCCLVWASATYGHDQGRPVTFAHIKPSQLLDVQPDHPGSTPCAHDFVQAARPEDIRLLPDGHGGGEHAAAIKSGHSPHSAGQLLGYGSSASWQSMKFYHEAQGLETDITDTTVMAGRSASSIRSFLTDKLVPSAIAWFERTLSVRPVWFPKFVVHTLMCSIRAIPLPGVDSFGTVWWRGHLPRPASRFGHCVYWSRRQFGLLSLARWVWCGGF